MVSLSEVIVRNNGFRGGLPPYRFSSCLVTRTDPVALLVHASSRQSAACSQVRHWRLVRVHSRTEAHTWRRRAVDTSCLGSRLVRVYTTRALAERSDSALLVRLDLEVHESIQSSSLFAMCRLAARSSNIVGGRLPTTRCRPAQVCLLVSLTRCSELRLTAFSRGSRTPP